MKDYQLKRNDKLYLMKFYSIQKLVDSDTISRATTSYMYVMNQISHEILL
jgi:hypothetical protein